MSLAAIIIAMGMLVDNAIVVYDATLVNMQRGMRKRIAIINAATSTPKVLNARNEWGNMAMVIEAGYDPVKAGMLNIGRADMMNAVKSVYDGTTIGVYRDGENKVPVRLITEKPETWDTEYIKDLQIWNGKNSAPLAQVADGITTGWEYPLVRTYNRKLSMAAQCDVKRGHTMKETFQ